MGCRHRFHRTLFTLNSARLAPARATAASHVQFPLVVIKSPAPLRPVRLAISRIGDAKLIRSMSRKGCSPDNAACEGFFGWLKTELFYPRDWKTTTIEQFIEVVNSYIRWYNEKRIKISLGSLSPIEYRESLGLTA